MHKCMLGCFSHVQLSVTPWTVACQAPLSMGFFRQEHWSGLPYPPPGEFPDPGIKPVFFFVSCIGRQVPYQWCHDTWIESLKTPEKDNGTLAASCSCNAVVCRIVPSCPVTGNSNRSSLEMVIIIANHFCVSSCVWCWLFLLFSGQSFICYNYCHFRDKKTEPWRKVTHPGSNQQ